MHGIIRDMKEEDRESILAMMRVFYASEAVLSNGSEEIFDADITACVSGDPYLEGYVFESGQDLLGYAMAAKSFSTEFGKHCIWIEDLYVKPSCRGMGLGSGFLQFIGRKYPDAVLRLEVEAENNRAVRVYQKCGFEQLPYMEMKK